MRKPVRFLSHHRRTRLIAWTLALLSWTASVLSGFAPNARHARQREHLLPLPRITGLVCDLGIIRAVELIGRPPRRFNIRNATPTGFRRRTAPSAFNRARLGAKLRRDLRRGDLAQRIRFLAVALADIDAFARCYLVRRLRRGLTRFAPVLPIAPCADVFAALAALSPALADSS